MASTGSIFAEHTSVAVEKSKAELERLLVKHGAGQYGTAHDDINGFAIVYFVLAGRHIRLQIPIPAIAAYPDPKLSDWQQKKKTPQRRAWWSEATRAVWVREQWEQACRQRWRCMLLIVKAKLELIALKLSDVDHEFLADITLPDGRSVGEWLKPGIDQAYMAGEMPRLLGMGPSSGPRGMVDATLDEEDRPNG